MAKTNRKENEERTHKRESPAQKRRRQEKETIRRIRNGDDYNEDDFEYVEPIKKRGK